MRDTYTPKPHSSATARGQACAFLRGVGLPEAWAGLPQWRIVDTDFACGLNFLRAWHAWRADAQRPTLLHFVAAHAHPPSATDLGRTAAFDPPIDPALASLVHELSSQWWGLLPGVHRLRFDEGRVLLTLHVSTAHAMLRGQSLTADSVYLHDAQRGLSEATSTVDEGGVWDQHAFKAMARCCRRGTRLVCDGDAPFVRTALAHCGFEVAGALHGEHHEHDQVCQAPSAHLHATFNPAWEPRGARHTEALPRPTAPSACLVIGAGLAGAAAAASLARRGWHVRVLDAANTPAAGASGLP
ncbi:MAG: FAD-dependent oxidoreductase, partial [Burkholderiaceae bacterium]|nr:FAD-dependent oxidoreductase [Burkholderiaceae bacterium]